MIDPITKADLAALFDWCEALGADEMVGATPADWYALSANAGKQARPRQDTGAAAPARAADVPRAPARPGPNDRTYSTTAPDDAVLAGRELAKKAQSLDELHAHLAAFDGCTLKKAAKNLCFYRGSADARLMIIGEAPGRDEDLRGIPFIGAAGRLLDKMLAAISLGEDDVHITNIVYWRPPGNRNPTPQEALVCRPFLDRQIELVDPDMILLLGRPAANQLLENAEGIMKLRGKWKTKDLGGRSRPVMAALHPAYLLRTPAAKRLAWRDLLSLREKIDGPGDS